jgi:hypothetical protein
MDLVEELVNGVEFALELLHLPRLLAVRQEGKANL